MSEKQRSLIFSLCIIFVTAVSCFVIGAIVMSAYGTPIFHATEVVYVAATTATDSGSQATTETTLRRPISLNNASKAELMMIPGVGEKYAERIIAYREEIGGFTSLEQLMNVSGIGEKRFKEWSAYLVL